MENRHESVKTPVRMVLYDYDAAPDGAGTYVVIDATFPSVEAALQHRNQMWCGDLYWGHIEDTDGKTVETLLTVHEQEAEDRRHEDDDYDWWAEHRADCDGCHICDNNAYPDED